VGNSTDEKAHALLLGGGTKEDPFGSLIGSVMRKNGRRQQKGPRPLTFRIAEDGSRGSQKGRKDTIRVVKTRRSVKTTRKDVRGVQGGIQLVEQPAFGEKRVPKTLLKKSPQLEKG